MKDIVPREYREESRRQYPSSSEQWNLEQNRYKAKALLERLRYKQYVRHGTLGSFLQNLRNRIIEWWS